MMIKFFKELISEIWSRMPWQRVRDLELSLFEKEKEIKDLMDKAEEELEKKNKEIETLEVELAKLRAESKKPIEPPKGMKVITREEVKNKLREKFKNVKLHLSELNYGVTSLEEMKLFLAKDNLDKMEYISEVRDCDDFAVMLWARVKEWYPDLCFGVLWISSPIAHAINVFVDNELNLWVCEPQTDLIYKIPEDYECELLII